MVLKGKMKIDFKDKNKIYIIAEIGMTHDGSIGLAHKLTESAIKSGANIIKYQWHIAEEETTEDAPSPPYFKGETRFSYFKRTEFSIEQFKSLVKQCIDSSVIPCVSVFSIESLQRAIKAGFKIIKIPSGEVTNIPLLREIALKDIPVIISSGMSNWEELDNAINVLKKNSNLCVLQCTSMYPTPPEKVGLNILLELKKRYTIPYGLSDHTLSGATSISAVTLGAQVIEKHFTISKKLYGPDARFSLEPEEFKKLVQDINYVKKALTNKVDKNQLDSYKEMKLIFQKSIFSNNFIKKGEKFDLNNLSFKKPGSGIPASNIDDIIGKISNEDIQKGAMIKKEWIRN